MNNKDIAKYIYNLNYSPEQLLAVPQDSDIIPDGKSKKDTGNGVTVCETKKSKLSGNFDEQFMLSPIQDVIWPGNLIAADKNLVNGIPAAIRLQRAPSIKIKVDLPKAKNQGVVEVNNPSFTSVQSAIDDVVIDWIEKSKDEGYYNKSLSRFSSSVAYSTEQIAASLGINYKATSSSIGTQLSISSNTEKKVVIGFFKQVFYSAIYDVGNDVSSVFADDVTLDEVKDHISEKRPCAYVSQVDYGRLIFLRIESSSTTLNTDLEAILKYSNAGGSLDADTKMKYNKIVQESSLTVFTVGGNAVVNTKLVKATSLDDLTEAIIGEQNSVLGKKNHGSPISYVVKFLKDSSLAKLSYSFDYSITDCKHYNYGWVAVQQLGFYVGWFIIKWTDENGKRHTWSSGSKTRGYQHKLMIDPISTDIEVYASCNTGDVGNLHPQIIMEKYSNPPNKWFKIFGTTLNRSYSIDDKPS